MAMYDLTLFTLYLPGQIRAETMGSGLAIAFSQVG